MSDAELVAFAMLAQIQAMSMHEENVRSRGAGQSVAYVNFYSDYSNRLHEELKKRAVIS